MSADANKARPRDVDQEHALSLQERELLKFASLAKAIARALQQRDIKPAQAAIAAEAAVAIFTVSFTIWIQDGEQRPLNDIQHATTAQLRSVFLPD